MRPVQSKSLGKGFLSFRCRFTESFSLPGWRQTQVLAHIFTYQQVKFCRREMYRESLTTTDLSSSLSGYCPVLSLYNSILLLFKELIYYKTMHINSKLNQEDQVVPINSFVYDLETNKKIQATAFKIKKSLYFHMGMFERSMRGTWTN